ncbi:hypothetical protein RZS08_08950 [Arthrospira platensis SPKY1]|nr:hypothetical protein [Arthrospira platensis SPKY1]
MSFAFDRSSVDCSDLPLSAQFTLNTILQTIEEKVKAEDIEYLTTTLLQVLLLYFRHKEGVALILKKEVHAVNANAIALISSRKKNVLSAIEGMIPYSIIDAYSQWKREAIELKQKQFFSIDSMDSLRKVIIQYIESKRYKEYPLCASSFLATPYCEILEILILID